MISNMVQSDPTLPPAPCCKYPDISIRHTPLSGSTTSRRYEFCSTCDTLIKVLDEGKSKPSPPEPIPTTAHSFARSTPFSTPQITVSPPTENTSSNSRPVRTHKPSSAHTVARYHPYARAPSQAHATQSQSQTHSQRQRRTDSVSVSPTAQVSPNPTCPCGAASRLELVHGKVGEQGVKYLQYVCGLGRCGFLVSHRDGTGELKWMDEESLMEWVGVRNF